MSERAGEDLDLLTAAEVADLLQVGIRTAVRKLDAAGVPSIRLGRKLRYWRRSAVATFLLALETGAAPSTAARGRTARPATVAGTSHFTSAEKDLRAKRIAHVLSPGAGRGRSHRGA